MVRREAETMTEPTTAACEWCGRAVAQNPEGRWYAVKGEERGYDPLTCDASDDCHPDMPPFKQGEDCPFLRDWVHFCDLGRWHKGSHHCPCGLKVPRGR
jgi:endogenous inhibitor of DNA gyrase (YacG/DUF329 family)